MNVGWMTELIKRNRCVVAGSRILLDQQRWLGSSITQLLGSIGSVPMVRLLWIGYSDVLHLKFRLMLLFLEGVDVAQKRID